MAEADPLVRARRAKKLAGWTTLSEGEFRIGYDKCLVPGSAPTWEALVATPGAGLIAAACEAAAKGNFIDRLILDIANREYERGRSYADIDDLYSRTSATGQMQAVFDQHRGLMSAAILIPLTKAWYSCAVVQLTRGVAHDPVGTAFLVRPDMVLTAGHVALDRDTAVAPGQNPWLARLRPGLSFSFKGRDNMPATDRFEVLPHPDKPLLAHSNPFGAADGSLFVDLAPPADTCLDFALIRLAQRVDHVEPLTVDPPPGTEIEVEDGQPCWAFGFAAGSNLLFDVNAVTRVSDDAGRWLHKAGTAPGTSGGCCFNRVGQLLGIHEGTVEWTQDQASIRNNRGILLKAIRNAQKNPGPDPLDIKTATPGLEIPDPTLAAALVRAGRQLSDADFAPKWDALVRAVFPAADFATGAGFPALYPWFPRKEIEDWVSEDDPATYRLCTVSGPRGAGKSFCARILKERLDPSGLGFFEINQTQLAAFSLRETTGDVSVEGPSPTRTSAASVRYIDVNNFIEDLRSRSTSNRTWHVVIDFGAEGDGERLLMSQWQELVIALLGQDWIRVMLIGLTDGEQADLLALVQGRLPRTVLYDKTVALAPIDAPALERYAQKLAVARGKPLPAVELRQLIAEIRTLLLGTGDQRIEIPDQMQTAVHALMAMSLGASL